VRRPHFFVLLRFIQILQIPPEGGIDRFPSFMWGILAATACSKTVKGANIWQKSLVFLKGIFGQGVLYTPFFPKRTLHFKVFLKILEIVGLSMKCYKVSGKNHAVFEESTDVIRRGFPVKRPHRKLVVVTVVHL
jgi:hypothetical protein